MVFYLNSSKKSNKKYAETLYWFIFQRIDYKKKNPEQNPEQLNGKQIKLKKGTRVFETTIKGISETGQLITQHSIEERFEFGEVEWVLQ
jgi:hypothetical protein